MTSPTPDQNQEAQPAADGESLVFRRAGISYVHIPAEDPRRSAAFYQAVFGWNVRGDSDHPSFDDGRGM
jgi:protein tyrosine phosphatase (PTP) superfamily phosphohydrolase (DUF442 family)